MLVIDICKLLVLVSYSYFKLFVYVCYMIYISY